MSAPRWYTGTPDWLWPVVITLALALGCWFAGRATVRSIRQDERDKVLAEGDRLVAVAQGVERARWQHVVDSLRKEAARLDTVLDTVFLRAKAETAKPIPPTKDTTALVAAVRSCRATLDTLAQSCASFRESATTALAKADTIQRRDSAAIAGLSLQLAVIRRADSTKAATLASRSRWRTLERGVCAGSVAFNAFTLFRKN